MEYPEDLYEGFFLTYVAEKKECTVCGNDAHYVSGRYKKPYCGSICHDIEHLIEERRRRK